MISSYLGVILVAASFLALGVGISAVFTNQVAAFFVTLSVFVFLWWLIGFPASFCRERAGEVFQYLSMQSHFYDAFNVGNIKLSDLVYFVSLIALGLFMGTTADRNPEVALMNDKNQSSARNYSIIALIRRSPGVYRHVLPGHHPRACLHAGIHRHANMQTSIVIYWSAPG